MTVSNESLKEYYVKLQQMYNNCYNMLTAIQQSLSTTASEITVTVSDGNDAESTIRIPSFLYLENKLEQLDSNFSNLFNMPDSGEAWFSKSSDMYKLELVRSSSAPIQPVISEAEKFASFSQTTILKDLVSPHMFLRTNIDNLPESAKEVFMKKVVIYDATTFDALTSANIKTYDEWRAALYNYSKGEDYEEYDSVVKLPIRKDTFSSQFNITEIVEQPWIDTTYGNHHHHSYRLKLSTLEYTNEEDSSIRYTLKAGDAVCLGNEMVVYVVKTVNTAENEVVIEEVVGHIALQTYDENTSMQLKLYNNSYSEYKYVDLPLEEDRYVVMFLSVVYNNVRSELSDALVLDLTKIYMHNENGQLIYDDHGNPLSYIDYYRKYCTNIGDLILGLTESAFPQLSNYTSAQLLSLTEDEGIATAVTDTIDTESSLQVVPINKHLIDDTSSDQIVNLHAQKNNIQAQLLNINDNISQVYNTMTNTDFSQQTANTFASMQSKLTSYYTERTTLQKQLNSIIDSIAAKSTDVTIANSKTKYRIRGVLDTTALETMIAGIGDDKTTIVGAEIEYKYKSTSKDTNTVTIINSSTFTDWNRQQCIDRGRHIEFQENTRSWSLAFNDYKSTDNVIKWNQVDIPITPGEDVIIRVRYKYNIGQPFVDIMTPWSDEVTVVFPPEFLEDNNVMTIVDTNQRDTVVAGFRDILMNEGYEEHVTNKVVAGEQVFMHQPQNIYSGFTTQENSLISLYDKLVQMSQDIEQYKSWVDGESNSKFDVYLQYDGNNTLLTPNTVNKINIYNTEHISGTFIKKTMNIVIKNTGTTRLNLFSIFPGATDISLIRTDIDSYNSMLPIYERVPIMINGELSLQNLGQWIYFRQTNPYTREDILYNTDKQRAADVQSAIDKKDPKKSWAGCNWDITSPTEYMMSRKQIPFVYRDRINAQYSTSSILNTITGVLSDMSTAISNSMSAITKANGNVETAEVAATNQSLEKISDTLNIMNVLNNDTTSLYSDWTDNDFYYRNTVWTKVGERIRPDEDNNNYLYRYEDIIGIPFIDGTGIQTTVQLDETTNITNFVKQHKVNGFEQDTNFCGAFLFPDLLSRKQITTSGQENDKVFIDSGESITLPIVFEYYLDGTYSESVDHRKVTKSLFFDIKNSLIKNPVHYMLEITGHYDFTSSSDMYSNFAAVELQDNVTNA